MHLTAHILIHEQNTIMIIKSHTVYVFLEGNLDKMKCGTLQGVIDY